MICKVCLQDKDETKFTIVSWNKDKTIPYRVKSCRACVYKIKKESGKIQSYHKTHPEKWCEYQKEYARVNYYNYYKKRGLENPVKTKDTENE